MIDTSKKTYRISLYGIMFATIAVAMAIDKVVSMSFLPISTAVCVLLVTFSFCLIQNDILTAFLAGTFFGLASLIKAFIFGEIMYIAEAVGGGNPIVLIYAILIYLIPRLFVGPVTFGVYRLMKKVFAKMEKIRLRETLALSIAIFMGLIANTVLFLLALNITKTILYVEHSTLFGIIKVVIFTNILPEYLVSIALAPQIIIGVRKALHLGIEANPIKPQIIEN
ncbi:MAG TPA: hypothetical protein P5087_00715 [Eubacteriales bacterium]|nr:hypothetical protein [Eubacteriales bacterium]